MVSIWLTRVKGSCFPLALSLDMKKNRPRGARPICVKFDFSCRLLAILLNAGGAKAGEAVLVDRKLPGKEFVDGQGIAAAGLFEGEQATANGSHDFGLAADDPTFGPG